MRFVKFILLLLLSVLSLSVHAAIMYTDFEDYLAMIEGDPTDEDDDEDGSAQTDVDAFIQVTTPVPEQDHTPRRTTCCELGHLAGVGGFHCNPEYYKPRMFIRNRNRSHNAKLRFHEEDDQPFKQGYSMMRQFRKCVGGFSLRLKNEFHKCCKYAYMEQQKTHSYARSKVDTDGPSKHSKHRDRDDNGDRVKEEELLLIHGHHDDRGKEEKEKEEEEEHLSVQRNHDDLAKEEQILSMIEGRF